MAVFNLHGVTSTPADNGSNATTTVTITPPAGMNDGDLVIVYLTRRTNATTFSIDDDGGQTWIEIGPNLVTSNVALQTYWARFNGTWSTNPIFNFGGTTNTTAVMLVFRSDVPTNNWDTETTDTSSNAAATVQTISGFTPVNPDSITVGSWSSPDDNQWGSLSGAGWSKVGLSNQYRNLAGQDSSSSFAYYLQTGGPSAIPNVSQTQLTVGADVTTTRRITFYNFTPAAYTPWDHFGMMGMYGV